MDKIFFINFLDDPSSTINDINAFLSLRSIYEVKSVTAVQQSGSQNANGRYGAIVVVGPCKN